MDLILIVAGLLLIIIGHTSRNKRRELTQKGSLLRSLGGVIFVAATLWFVLGFYSGFTKTFNNSLNLDGQSHNFSNEPTERSLKASARVWLFFSEEDKKETQKRFNTTNAAETIREMALYFDSNPESLALAEAEIERVNNK